MSEQTISLPEVMTVPRTDPIYNCHAYLTKVPVAAITPFIEAFSKPGDTVVDFFAGSGMTGLAAHMIGRKARLSDISVLGQHIANGYIAKVDAGAFRKAAEQCVETTRKAIGDLYKTRRSSDDAEAEMIRTVWSFTYICPSCGSEMVYFEHLSPSGAQPDTCPSCEQSFVRRSWKRSADVPVEVVVSGENGRQLTQSIAEIDHERIRAAQEDGRLARVPSHSIEADREMYSRSALAKAGLTETSKFFSPRNAIVLFELWNAISKVDDSAIRQKLLFAFTAVLPRASRRYQWSAKRPLNAQNQTYYISPVYYEWNVFELFGRKIEAAIRADDIIDGREGPLLPAASKQREVSYDLASADRLEHLGAASVDYIFTDPPFGSNIFYSDMSLFHEAWLGKTTDNTSEAVVHTTGKRKNGAEQRYHDLLLGAFREGYRVLKPGGRMSVVFGNSSGRVWGLVQRALRDAGFAAKPVHVAILDKGQRSVKGLNSGSEGVVTVDLIMTVEKPEASTAKDDSRGLSNGDTQHLINAAIQELPSIEAKNPSHLYGRILSKAIQEHVVLDDLHLGDVLVALRKAGHTIDPKTGTLRLGA
ncbi:DNA methyltransferase [Pseudogemmobacter sonorensis]|uniref:DNA methyltransferase n=1 Tax=Pseudogemmobacter sonorensis TaxID=2989681 RepID=UPI00369A9239